MNGISAWFRCDDTGTDAAEVWVDHHRSAHERDPDRNGWTLCGTKVIGGNAPTHAEIGAVGCRNCAARRAARKQFGAVA